MLVGGLRLLVVRTPGGGVAAVAEQCPHAGASLAAGELRRVGGELRITCPMHQWSFALPTGICREGERDVPAFETRVRHGVVEIALRGAEPGGAEPGGAEPGAAEPGAAEPGTAEPEPVD